MSIDSGSTVYVSFPREESASTVYHSLEADATETKSLRQFSFDSSLIHGRRRDKRRQLGTKVIYFERVEKCGITRIYSNSNSLVKVFPVLPGTMASEDSAEMKLPVFCFKSHINWKLASQVLLSDRFACGVYLLAFRWRMKQPFYYPDANPVPNIDLDILHCVCKEEPIRYQGRIGPISAFIPHQSDGRSVNGIWISLLPAEQFRMKYIDHEIGINHRYVRRLKCIHPDNNQIMFFMSNSAGCVGIQVLNTKTEEVKLKKSNTPFHHERPIILEDGFYLIDGIFETKFLNYDPNVKLNVNGKQFENSESPKIVIIGEGLHLIRTYTQSAQAYFQQQGIVPTVPGKVIKKKKKVKNNNSPSKNNEPTVETDQSAIKLRRVEVCLDCSYQKLIVLDHNLLCGDFKFKLNNQNNN